MNAAATIDLVKVHGTGDTAVRALDGVNVTIACFGYRVAALVTFTVPR